MYTNYNNSIVWSHELEHNHKHNTFIRLVHIYARDFYVALQFTTNLSPILIGLNWSPDAIVFIRGEILSAQSARPQKICGWMVVIRENFPAVNKRASRKETIEIVLSG